MKKLLGGDLLLYYDDEDNTLHVSADKGRTTVKIDLTRGEKGPRGAKGETGAKGEKGEKGERGEPGAAIIGADGAADGEILVADGKGGVRASGLRFTTGSPDGRRDSGTIPTWNAVISFVRNFYRKDN